MEQNRAGIGPAAEAFIWASQRAFQLGLQAGAGGNISIRLGADRFLTKPTGKGLAECTADDLVVVDEKGNVVQGASSPTKEVRVHLSLLSARSWVQAVVHYHAPYATAYACRAIAIPLPTVHAKRILKTVPMIAEHPEGSRGLAAAVAEAFSDESVAGALMIKHGIIAVGGSVEQAQFHAELMEESARIGWLAQWIS